jgi:hypothetical protein
MGNSLRDTMQSLRAMLIADSTVTGLVGNEVLMEHILDADQGTVPFPCIIFALAEGGSSSYARSHQRFVFDLYAYSKSTSDNAMAIYDAAYNVFQSARVTTDNVTLKGWLREVERPAAMYNGALSAFTVRGEWMALTAG